MMKLLAVVCGVMALARATVADELLSKLRAASSKLQDGSLLPLHSKYDKYAFAKTRKYGLVTLFTARNAKYRCSNCVTAAATLEAVQRSIRHALKWDVSSEVGNATETYRNKSTIFFAMVDFDKAQAPFRAHNLQNVPFIGYLPPTEGDGAESKGAFEEGYVLAPGSDQSPGKVLEMIAQDQTEEGNVPQLLSMAAYTPVAIGCAVVVAVLAAAMAADPDSWVLVTRPALWLSGSLVVMAISISGVIYCVIRTPPMYAVDSKGSPVFFSLQDAQGQTVVEGLAAGGLAMAAGVGVILMIQAAKKGGQRSELGALVWILLGLCLFVVCYHRLVALYTAKVKWWTPGGLLSPELRSASRRAVGWLEGQGLAGRRNGWDVWAASPAAVDPWRLAQVQLERTEAGKSVSSAIAGVMQTVSGAFAAASNATSN